MATANPPLSTPGPTSRKPLSKILTPYLYLLPALLVMALITFYPMGYQVWMSFTDYGVRSLNPNSPTYQAPNVVGLQNYLNILVSGLPGGSSDSVSRFFENTLGLAEGTLKGLPTIPNFSFVNMLVFNLWWTFSNVGFHVALGILIAVILNMEGVWGRAIYRAIYILPIVIPALIIATVWRNMYDPDFGAINQLLRSFGGLFGIAPEVFDIRWIEQVDPAFPPIPLPLSYFAMLITNIWLGWPFMTIVATGALQSIPKDLYEAASIDGASESQQFWRITLPLLRPAMVPAAVLGIITTFNLFHIIYFISGGGPLRQTEILVTTAFRLVNENRLYGMAAAFCVYIFFVLLILTLLTNRITKATESYDA
jgi:arabinogalactan oligomer/maltooligosaccharide transport system permease protein